MAKKKLTRITQYGRNCGKPDYIGRLLGVVDDKLFSVIKRDKEAVRKVLSEETTLLSNVVSILEAADLNDNGFRIALAVKKVGKDRCLTSRLYISARIKTITAYTAGKAISVTTEAGAAEWFRVEELEEV
jgi:hypothetical protein